MKLGRDVESNILTKMHPLRKSHFERHLEPLQFLSLNEWAFEPYLLGYDFPRKFRFKHLTKGTIPVVSNAREFVKARANIDSSDKKIFCLAGSAGSGKSIIARRIAVEWFRESGNPVIFFDPPLVLDKKVLLDLMKEITEDYYKYFGEEDAQDGKPVRFLPVFERARPFLSELTELNNFLISLGKPADILMTERTSSLYDKTGKIEGVDVFLELDDFIDPSQIPVFQAHFSKFGIATDAHLLSRNMKEPDVSRSFFSLLYTSINGIQESLKRSLIDEYDKLWEQEKNSIRQSLSSRYTIRMPSCRGYPKYAN